MHYPIDEQEFLAEMRRQGPVNALAEEVISHMLPVINLSYECGRKGAKSLDGLPETGSGELQTLFIRWCDRAYHAGVLERMRRYIDRTGFKNRDYSLVLTEVYAFGELGAVEAACLAFDYGQAKGVRAARKAAKPRQAVGFAGPADAQSVCQSALADLRNSRRISTY